MPKVWIPLQGYIHKPLPHGKLWRERNINPLVRCPNECAVLTFAARQVHRDRLSIRYARGLRLLFTFAFCAPGANPHDKNHQNNHGQYQCDDPVSFHYPSPLG